MITEPKLILLDEPFAGIDPKTVGEIQDAIRNALINVVFRRAGRRRPLPAVGSRSSLALASLVGASTWASRA